ncbi:MAG: hypothetical protein ABUL62_18635 [Myxococcales bacterium]
MSSIAILLVGCASTTGRGWVGEARYEPSTVVIGSTHSNLAAIPATAELEPVADARPRLNHTVTLGEIEVAPATRGADAAPGGSSVTINNYNVMNVATPAYGYGYASFGYGRALPSFSPGAARTSAPTITPGQSWPAIADHGPSFPYHAGPASPWTRPQ